VFLAACHTVGLDKSSPAKDVSNCKDKSPHSKKASYAKLWRYICSSSP
jgi:hypothetical protein